LALLAVRELVDGMRVRYRELERMTGAPVSLHRALNCLHAEPGITASRLALRLGMKRPAVSQMLKSLIARGWAIRARTPQDQRAVQLYLTSGGQAIIDATGGRAVGALQRAVNQLTPTEVAALRIGLAALVRQLPPAPKARPARVAPSVARR
jgi:DNA-binding MarR family transcriptional regulator